MWTCALILLLLQPPPVESLPPELKAALDARQFLNARIDWEITSASGSGLQRHQGRSTYVGDEAAYEIHYPDLPPLISTTDHAIFRGLHQEGRLFENDGTALVCDLYEDPRRGHATPMDFRVVGMHAGARTGPTHDPFAPAPDSVPRYTVIDDGPLFKVVRVEELRNDTREARWWIDPQRNWNVVRYEQTAGEGPPITVVSTLAKFGDTWFPETVEYRAGDGTLRMTVRIRNIKVNQAELPERLTAAFIGVEPGTNITYHHTDGSTEDVRFDGRNIISVEEFRRRQKTGELTRGPAFIAALAELKDENARRQADERGTPSLWQEYVRRFIQRYLLDDAQAVRAWSIYRDCRDQADKYLSSRRSEFEKLAKQEDELTAAPDAEKLARLRARLVELRTPVEEIFEKQLVPRLEKLLTREQRERNGGLRKAAVPAATQAATSEQRGAG